MDLSMWLLGNFLFDPANITTEMNSRYKGARLAASDTVLQWQSPDLWGGVCDEKTRPIFIWSAPSEKKIGIIIKAGGNDNLSIDFPINVPTLRPLAGPYIPYTAT